jgi:nucleotide-binding universal stress UspA family protein
VIPVRYLVATDGSPSSLKAARFLVGHFCPGGDDEIFVTYVFPLPSDADCYDGIVQLPASGNDPRVAAVAAPVLARTCTALDATGSNVREVCLVGNPAREIVEFAMNLDIGLIVAGTRGRSLAKELYLGSVSNALVHRAPCSVLIVR